MTADRLKFRCYQCNQLLAVAASKAGSIVACPKCKAELLIPATDSSPPAPPTMQPSAKEVAGSRDDRTSTSTSLPSFLQGLEVDIPSEVADLRPEDLRVEAEFFASLTRPPLTVEPALDSNTPATLSSNRTPPASPPPRIEPSPRTLSIPLVPPAVDAGPGLDEASSSVLVSESVVPSIQIDTPTSLAPVERPRVVREVVLPASVVLAWSLFVLGAIACSFLAGLLVGHFLWKYA